MENQILCIWFSTASDSCSCSTQPALLFHWSAALAWAQIIPEGVCSCAGGSCHIPGIDTAADMSLQQRLWSMASCPPSPGPSVDPPGSLALGCAASLASSYSRAQELQGRWSSERLNAYRELCELSWAKAGACTHTSLPLLGWEKGASDCTSGGVAWVRCSLCVIWLHHGNPSEKSPW